MTDGSDDDDDDIAVWSSRSTGNGPPFRGPPFRVRLIELGFRVKFRVRVSCSIGLVPVL